MKNSARGLVNFTKNIALIGGAAFAAAIPEPWPGSHASMVLRCSRGEPCSCTSSSSARHDLIERLQSRHWQQLCTDEKWVSSSHDSSAGRWQMRILLAIDGSPHSQAAVDGDRAATVACKLYGSDCRRDTAVHPARDGVRARWRHAR